MSWLKQIGRWFRGNEEISSPEVFRSRLRKERALADRNGHRFSLVTFTFAQPLKSSHGPIAIIEKEIRLSDEVGWLAPDCLGLILPQTPVSGARLVADRIRTQLEDLGLTVQCQVSEYPRDDVFKSLSEQSETESDVSMEVPGEPEAAVAKRENYSEIDELLTIPLSKWKRALDVAIAGLMLVILSPAFLIMAAWIKLFSRQGPIFFVQERVGLNGNSFQMLKFRTMHQGSREKVHTNHLRDLVKSDEPMTKLDDLGDSRLLPLAGLLRRCAIDELPQLINVLKGEMSLVGPRPAMAYEVEEYQLWHLRRFDTLPGMTGSWQVNGKNRTTFTEMVRKDVSYAKDRNSLQDVGILLKTPSAVLAQLVDGYKKRANRRTGT